MPVVSNADSVGMPDTGPYEAGATVVYTCINPTDDVVGGGGDTATCQNTGLWVPDTLGVCMQASKTCRFYLA